MPRNEPHNLAHPPVREAVIEVRYAMSNPSSRLIAIKDVAKKLEANFPNSKPVHLFKGSIPLGANLKGGDTPRQSTEEKGIRATSPDGRWVAQFLVDRLIVSFVAKEVGSYPGWDEFIERYFEIWKAYSEGLHNETASRVGLRYINQIDTPPIEVALADRSEVDSAPMVTTFHQVTNELLGTTRSMVARTEIDLESPLRVLVQQVWQKQESAESCSLVLDVDALYLGEVPNERPAIEEVLVKLRHVKNRVFFGSLAPEVIKRFE